MSEVKNNNTLEKVNTTEYTSKDFASDQDVRWCSGCGDYSVLAQVQRTLPNLGIKKEDLVFVAGIGCSSRFPYYMDTYGYHTIHGRANTIASGIKVANPELSVWVSTGDGDCLSIGGNHFLHTLRRNIDINIILFNNQIYGLTKGQYSPTSFHGQISKSSPLGTVEYPVNPVSLALGAEGTFIAKSIDRDPKHLMEMIKRTYLHKGTSFLEVLQNCNIFNDGAFALYTDKETKEDNVLYIEHNKPLVFGKNMSKGIKLDGWKAVVVDISNGKYSVDDLLVYDEKNKELAFLLSEFSENPALPMPVGVFLDIERATYEGELEDQIANAKKNADDLSVDNLFKGTSSWEIK
ncbi:MAG: 2-oxoacid:ferredoxin oxidoreductase subunit beta [Ignavibacteria bacterium]|nr:2-oxoacid:ferredoxin oxidoreductase subunit beta [Ignavibacteria bacterium]